jgi:hypothetical protein
MKNITTGFRKITQKNWLLWKWYPWKHFYGKGIEDLHVTSSMTLRTVATMLEVFFCAAQDVLMEITLENGRK